MDGPAAADTSFELLDRFTAAGGIATKVCSHPARPARSPGNIRAAIDDSACRLGTDEVDLYFAHRDDPETDQGEYLDAFEELIQAGQVREIGTSLFTPERLRCAAAPAAWSSWRFSTTTSPRAMGAGGHHRDRVGGLGAQPRAAAYPHGLLHPAAHRS